MPVTSRLLIFALVAVPLCAISTVSAQGLDLDSVISLINHDSIAVNLEILQSLDKSMCNHYDARAWLYQKMAALNLDSVYIDYFHLGVWGCNFIHRYSGNVIGIKKGTSHPHHVVVIGAKYDSQPDSPGANDNSTGIAAVLEIARVLHNIDTRMTFVTALFDGGTWANLGAWNYATKTYQQRDSIVVALTLDQIGGGSDSTATRLGYRDSAAFADLWRSIADSLPGIDLNGILDQGSGNAANYPFEFNDYPAILITEYEPSPVTGGPSDSLQYLNLDYVARVAKTTLAAACAVDNNYDYSPGLHVTFPAGLPILAFPDRPKTFPVYIEEYGGAVINPGSCKLCSGAQNQHLSCTPMQNLGNGNFLASLPAFSLLDRVRFHVTVSELTSGNSVINADGEPFQAVCAYSADTVFHDDYEFDYGWVHGGDATVGAWHCTRLATGYFQGGYAPPCDRYGHGRAWNTGLEMLEDVDDGHATLRSLGIDLSSGVVATVELYLWYVNSNSPGSGDDVFDFLLSNDDGLNWVLAKRIGPSLPSVGGWSRQLIWINDFVELTDQVCLLYDVSDLGIDSPVEAAVDLVTFMVYSSDSTGPSIVTDSLPDWTANMPLLQTLVSDGGIGDLVWSDAYGNLIGTGLELAANGCLQGLPAEPGSVCFSAIVSDEYDNHDTASYSFTINPPLLIINTTLPVLYLGQALAVQLQHTGGTGGIQWSTLPGILEPFGLQLSPDGRLTGTPADTGSITFNVAARDEAGATAETEITLTIRIACGDTNADGAGPNVADLTFLVRYLFGGGSAPDLVAADVDASGAANVADVTRFVDYLFRNGPHLVCRGSD